MNTAVYLSTAYLGPVSYYCQLFRYPQVWMERHEHYLKQTYRSRCLIAAPDGRQALTIPIVRDDPSHSEVKDIRISSHGNWQHLHWQALTTAYQNSPFFEYYADDLRLFYEKPFEFLFDFNESLRETICRLLDLSPEVRFTDEYCASPADADDYRQAISPKQKEGTPLFRPCRYYQVFENRFGFLPDLSIADLLFNMGPESPIVLRDSIQRAI